MLTSLGLHWALTQDAIRVDWLQIERIEWEQVQGEREKEFAKLVRLLEFKGLVFRNDVLTIFDDNIPKWNILGLMIGFVF